MSRHTRTAWRATRTNLERDCRTAVLADDPAGLNVAAAQLETLDELGWWDRLMLRLHGGNR